MSVFLDAETLKKRTRISDTKIMDSESIEDMLIFPAERVLDSAFSLDLNTDSRPRHLDALFTSEPHRETTFRRDMRVCMILLCDRMASNPHGLSSQSVGRSSTSFGPKMPHEVKSIMEKWQPRQGKTGRVTRY